MTVAELEDYWRVHAPGEWENEEGPPEWWAVSSDRGIVAYFGLEEDAWEYRKMRMIQAIK